MGSSMCPSVHPTLNAQCELPEGNHEEHTFRGEDGWEYWENTEYTAPPPLKKKFVPRPPKPPAKHTRAEYLEIQREMQRQVAQEGKSLSRRDDPGTSAAGAESVSLRATGQKAMLLIEYYKAGEPLTDEEAAREAGLLDRPGCCWWHRSTDLRKDGLIRDAGTTKKSFRTGEERMVCEITDAGRSIAQELSRGPL
jgi:hypothetical protein